jgi:hypothetical protein
MKKRNKRKSEKQTLKEQQTLLKNFNPNETDGIKQLVKELHKIRKVDANREGFLTVEEQIEHITEQQFYYVGDFIIEMGWMSDRGKVETLWKYLQLEFSPK